MKKIAQRRTKGKTVRIRGQDPAAELTRKPSENLNNETPPGGVALLGGVFLCFSGCFFVALSAAFCGSLWGVLGVGGMFIPSER